jgi:hypothetical protein
LQWLDLLTEKSAYIFPLCSLPRIWSAVGVIWACGVVVGKWRGIRASVACVRALFVGNISIQPARLEVALRLIRVGRDRGPCGCYLGGFVDRN